MYNTHSLSLPTVMLPCTHVILVFPASLPGFVSAPSSQLSQARLCLSSSTEQAQTPPSQHSTGSHTPCSCLSWTAPAPVPVSLEMGGSCSQPGSPRFSLSCTGRSSTGQMWFTGMFGPQQTLKDEFALILFQPSGISATSLSRKKYMLHVFPSPSACLTLPHILCKKKKKSLE